MLSRILSMLSLLLSIAASLSPAQAACGQGKVPTYGDIDAIRYERTNCFGKCPDYQVLFASRNECYYVGTQYVPKHGTYEAVCSPAVVKRAIAVLERQEFYSLNYDSSILVLDAPHYIISVERCGVTTKLDWPWREDRKDIESLFSELDVITDDIRWHKVSNSLESPLPLVASIP